MLTYLLQNLLADHFGLPSGGIQIVSKILQHDHEFVATKARDRIIFAHACNESLCDLLEQGVANDMATRIVDVLEVVQVNQQQGATLATARRQAQCHFQALHQFTAIGQ